MSRSWLRELVAMFAVGVFASSGLTQEATNHESTPLEIFDQRIMPIFRSSQPSSCVQCHLSAVDLKNYILPSQEKTFASLRDQGLIDLQAPEKSKILTLIRMGDKDLDKGAQLIHEKTRKAEYAAFEAWVKACCQDPKIRDLPQLNPADLASPDKPEAVIRHARKSRVVDSFARNVWSQRMRCFPCHTPHEIDPSNPRQQAAIKTQNELKKKYSPELLARLNIFRETPEATLNYLVESSRNVKQGELPLLNLAEPRKSLILLKPTSKLPIKREDGTFEPVSSVAPVTHMGGLKMHPDDQSYKSFVAWIKDYSNVVGDRYVGVEELPADNWVATKRVLKLSSAPESWPIGIPVQLFVYTWNDEETSWRKEPVAFTQGTVTPRRMVNGAMFLLASRDAARATTVKGNEAVLGGGRYMVKVYVDLKHRLADDPTLLLGDEDFVGQAEFTRSRWREGFKFAAAVSGNMLKR
ncbi:MAG: hypothetical protein H8E66_16745 [Planctomycetes bacterium]|nr:hypothetical protein [Planctomycetota bacterium]